MKKTNQIRIVAGMALFLIGGFAAGQNSSFHNAPANTKLEKNPYQGRPSPVGKSAYQQTCAVCHGANGEGSGNIPSLASEKAQSASDGEIFWYITKGDVNNGMPSWASLPEEERWHIINYLRVLGAAKPGSPRVRLSADEAVSVATNAPPPEAPFTDTVLRNQARLAKLPSTIVSVSRISN